MVSEVFGESLQLSSCLWVLFLSQSFGLWFAFVAQWDNCVPCLVDDSSKQLSCLRVLLLTAYPMSAVESDTSGTGCFQHLLLSGLSSSGVQQLPPAFSQYSPEIALLRGQILHDSSCSFSLGSVHGLSRCQQSLRYCFCSSSDRHTRKGHAFASTLECFHAVIFESSFSLCPSGWGLQLF